MALTSMLRRSKTRSWLLETTYRWEAWHVSRCVADYSRPPAPKNAKQWLSTLVHSFSPFLERACSSKALRHQQKHRLKQRCCTRESLRCKLPTPVAMVAQIGGIFDGFSGGSWYNEGTDICAPQIHLQPRTSAHTQRLRYRPKGCAEAARKGTPPEWVISRSEISLRRGQAPLLGMLQDPW